MKTNTATKLAALLIALIATPLAMAEEKHDHDHEHAHKTGPNGGHIVESKAGFILEVAVDKDRNARIIFLDKDLKPLPLAEQTITGIAGPRSAPVKLTFAKGTEKDADVLIADKALPAGAHIQVILTIKTAPDAKPVTERFELHLH
jgi:hypothetical protein